MVEAGLTVMLPAHATAPTPWSMAQLVAFATPPHASVDDPPATIATGLAPNVAMAGAWAVTVNVRESLVPRNVVMVTSCAPIPPAAMVKVAVTDVSVDTDTSETVTPLPFTTMAVPPGTKPAPVSVTRTAVPDAPSAGLTAVKLGPVREGDRDGSVGLPHAAIRMDAPTPSTGHPSRAGSPIFIAKPHPSWVPRMRSPTDDLTSNDREFVREPLCDIEQGSAVLPTP